MKRSLTLACLVWVATAIAFAPRQASAQLMGGTGSMPLAVDLKKVPVGSWADYNMTVNLGTTMTMKSRWALVGREGGNHVLEMGIEGGPAAMMGGKMIMKMTLAPDPTAVDKPITRLVMQIGDRDPMDMPTNMPNMPGQQKFQKPDPKKLVGKEEIKVPAGSYKTSHYRDVTPAGTLDLWINETVRPLGVIKMTTSPKPGATGPNGQPLPPVSMELAAVGKDAKPVVTKPAKPFDPSALFGGARPPAPKP